MWRVYGILLLTALSTVQADPFTCTVRGPHYAQVEFRAPGVPSVAKSGNEMLFSAPSDGVGEIVLTVLPAKLNFIPDTNCPCKDNGGDPALDNRCSFEAFRGRCECVVGDPNEELMESP